MTPVPVLSCFLALFLLCLNSKCNPNNVTCWPTQTEIQRFEDALLTSDLLTPSSSEHEEYTKPHNSLINVRPHFILIIQSTNCKQDIMNAILFIEKHNMELTIFSTGHSYNGKSVGIHNDSFQINLRAHKLISFGNTAQYTTVTATTSVTFSEIYSAVNTTYPHKVFIGGECHSVGIGGYTLGGGMSPISCYFGLTIDSVYSFELITANLSHIICYKNGTYFVDNDEWNDNTDLFWAMKGGGGGTFGIILNITFILYDLPNNVGITSLLIRYPFYYVYNDNTTLIADDVLNNFMVHLANLTSKVNGYVLFVVPFPQQPMLVFDLIYIGDIDEAKSELNCISEYHREWQMDDGYQYKYYDTFWNWQSLIITIDFVNNYVFSNMYSYQNITSFSVGYIDKMIAFGMNAWYTFEDDAQLWDLAILVYFNLILGGNVSNIGANEAAITPKVRNAAVYSCGLMQWKNKDVNMNVDDKVNLFMANEALIFENISIGSYLNEDTKLRRDWIESYWTKQHYNKLMDIKKLWDKKELFRCHHCVSFQVPIQSPLNVQVGF